MTVQEIGAILESDAVQGDLALASTWGSFKQRVADNPVLCRLRDNLGQESGLVEALSECAYGLWHRPVDPAYAAPHDIPLAAVLCLLPPYPCAVIRDLAWRIHDQHSPNLFWARAAAAAIVLPSEKRIEAWPQADKLAATIGGCIVCGKPVPLADATAFFSDAITHRGPCADRFSGELRAFICQVRRQFAEARGERL